MKKILFLMLVLSQVANAGYNVFIMKDGTKIKSSASESASTVTEVKRGVQLEIIGEEGNWYKVSNGFIYKKDGMKIKTSANSTKTTPASASQPKKEEKKVDKKTQKLNKEWKAFEISSMGDVSKANEKAQEGIDGAIYPLVKALEHKKAEIRTEAENCLVNIGARSLKALAPKTKSKIYLVKAKAISIMGEIGSDEAVPYLERVIRDKSVEKDVVNALNSINGSEAKSAIARYNKSKIMAQKMDSIRAYQEEKDKARLSKLGLVYGDTKNNILDVAMKLAQFKKTNTPKTNPEYKEYREVFAYLVRDYDNKLGKGASEQLLKDNGYSKDVLN